MNVAGRRSISAKHNNENGKVSAPPTITKSYTSTKKEELLQVINKVKQQLENVSGGLQGGGEGAEGKGDWQLNISGSQAAYLFLLFYFLCLISHSVLFCFPYVFL